MIVFRQKEFSNIERDKKIEAAAKQFPWINDILGNLPEEYFKVKKIESELKKRFNEFNIFTVG